MKVVVAIEPIGKPRMTRRDVWKKRPAVIKYRAFCDELRLNAKHLSNNFRQYGVISWVAYFSMPPSWSQKKKADMKGKPHRQRPDRDNVDKAILDALFPEDSSVWSGYLEKRWDDGNGARIEISYD